MISDSAKCAKSAKCFKYARGSGSVFFLCVASDRAKIGSLRPNVRLQHFAHFAHFARVGAGRWVR